MLKIRPQGVTVAPLIVDQVARVQLSLGSFDKFCLGARVARGRTATPLFVGSSPTSDFCLSNDIRDHIIWSVVITRFSPRKTRFFLRRKSCLRQAVKS